MPYGWFVLQRFFLRVDNVLFRMFDVRVFHHFDSDEIVRECNGYQSSWNDVKSVSNYSQKNK